MSMQVITPTSKENWLQLRVQDITSTEVSALFGLSPYMTEFELWHRKKDAVIVEISENERTKWGTALQDAIAEQIAKDNGWQIRRMDEYIRRTDMRSGSSFDFCIVKDNGALMALLEIKNVDNLVFRDNWTINDDKSIEAPAHIEIQVQHQMMVSGCPHAYIGALIGGNKLEVMRRDEKPQVHTVMAERIRKFWASIEANEPPKPDFQRDAKFISGLYGYAEPNKVLDARDNEEFITLAREHKRLGDIMKDADEKRDALKAQMLTIMGDAEKVEGGEFSISAGIIGAAEISYIRKEYRNFKPTWRKKK